MYVIGSFTIYDYTTCPANMFEVKDKDLLSPKEQMLLVRQGYIYLPNGDVLLNNQENKIYLNEGGLEHGIG